MTPTHQRMAPAVALALGLGLGMVAIACGGPSSDPTGPVVTVYASPT